MMLFVIYTFGRTTTDNPGYQVLWIEQILALHSVDYVQKFILHEFEFHVALWFVISFSVELLNIVEALNYSHTLGYTTDGTF